MEEALFHLSLQEAHYFIRVSIPGSRPTGTSVGSLCPTHRNLKGKRNLTNIGSSTT